MSGGKNLIGLRSRGGNNRPFLVVENLQKNAELLLKEKEDSLKNDLQDTEKKLKELTENNNIDQQNLTLEQTETINNFNKKIFQIRKDLREVQRELGENIKKLETNLKLINIWLMPLLVIVVFFIFKYYTNRKYKKYINTI
jgi:Fe2+ transport system protein B